MPIASRVRPLSRRSARATSRSPQRRSYSTKRSRRSALKISTASVSASGPGSRSTVASPPSLPAAIVSGSAGALRSSASADDGSAARSFARSWSTAARSRASPSAPAAGTETAIATAGTPECGLTASSPDNTRAPTTLRLRRAHVRRISSTATGAETGTATASTDGSPRCRGAPGASDAAIEGKNRQCRSAAAGEREYPRMLPGKAPLSSSEVVRDCSASARAGSAFAAKTSSLACASVPLTQAITAASLMSACARFCAAARTKRVPPAPVALAPGAT
mmetsp:Transcript_15859/g.51975  ORF Transcript_15859/g.51975 Transcript_15859/m.51975 type:complete len:278 (-) Transcript_15859:912-1745(-)